MHCSWTTATKLLSKGTCDVNITGCQGSVLKTIMVGGVNNDVTITNGKVCSGMDALLCISLSSSLSKTVRLVHKMHF